MRAKIFTLRFSATLGGFDDSALQAFTGDKEILTIREHFFSVNEVQHLACIVTWQEPVVTPEDLEAARTLDRGVSDRSRSSSSSARSGRSRSDPAAGLDEQGRSLFNTLRQWRMEKSREEGVPPYLVFTNRHLIEMVTRRPESANALGQLSGIGPGKIKRYGAEVLGLLHGEGAGLTPEAADPEAENSASPEAAP